jgi:hypothetical protein
MGQPGYLKSSQQRKICPIEIINLRYVFGGVPSLIHGGG